ncbi:HEPN domain-containing protein [Desulfosoma caldarium]|nr:HEPN domain-containing protein [Desulfosoma caldarium]
MKADTLAHGNLDKARVGLEALQFYQDRQAFFEVVREVQELVEPLLKAILRALGEEVPTIHGVGRVLVKFKGHLPRHFANNLHEIRKISKSLQKERELSLYGAEGFIPTEEYGAEEVTEAIREASFVYDLVSGSFQTPDIPVSFP